MQKRIIIFFLFSTSFLYSQDQYLNSLKSQDTIYLILKYNKKEVRKEYKTFFYQTLYNKSLSEYKFQEKNQPKEVTVRVEYRHEPIKICNKKGHFLNENKGKIIDINLIETFGIDYIFNTLLKINKQEKVFYVIDERELKKRKITLRKATIVATGYIKM
ncbi:hypothetical protein [Flavobacterium alkalisoli]|uniref:hypothetical protein n=1 Tax=Flavobacterium alkalisoli TaxID=2602769 RepID=UPI003A936F9C